MPQRRILSLWFPRLAAERVLRVERGLLSAPFAVAGDRRGAQVLVSLSVAAQAAGLRRLQPVRDARAMCPELVTRLESPRAEAAFLAALQRWAGKFSPWIAPEPPSGLVADLTGCAHLFGGEAPLLAQVEADCADLGLTVRAGIADTLGAAWALARYGGGGAGADMAGPAEVRSGDAIDQEARATRSRAVKRRHWERGGAPPEAAARPAAAARIAPQGQVRRTIGPLPVAALRLPEEVTAQLARLGLRRIEDLAGQPRAGLARRFGQTLVMRLDQAMGAVPEPVSPAAAPPRFAVRLTLPEPIGLEADVAAALDRLLPPLADRLRAKGRGARRVRLRVDRTDRTTDGVEIGLARPTADPERLRPLLRMKLAEIEAGDGIDVVRLEAHVTEPVHATQHRGQLAVSRAIREDRLGEGGAEAPGNGLGDGLRYGHGADHRADHRADHGAEHGADHGAEHGAEQGTAYRGGARRSGRLAAPGQGAGQRGGLDVALDDLIGRLGARVGLEEILRLHPGDSHIPEKTSQVRAAAYSEPADSWVVPAPVPRPLVIFRPEPVHAPSGAPRGKPPDRFRWRRRELRVLAATGPERISPEWWLDAPDWRTGVRDYWQVEVSADAAAQTGERLWLFYAHGADLSAGWFCQGRFA